MPRADQPQTKVPSKSASCLSLLFLTLVHAHRVQWMQRFMTVFTSGPMFLSSTARFVSTNRERSDPKIMAWSCRSHSPPWSHMGQSSGWLICTHTARGCSSVGSDLTVTATCCTPVHQTPAQYCCVSVLLLLTGPVAVSPQDGSEYISRYTACAHQQELHDTLARLLHHRRVCLDAHAWTSWHGTGCLRLGALLNLQVQCVTLRASIAHRLPSRVVCCCDMRPTPSYADLQFQAHAPRPGTCDSCPRWTGAGGSRTCGQHPQHGSRFVYKTCVQARGSCSAGVRRITVHAPRDVHTRSVARLNDRDALGHNHRLAVHKHFHEMWRQLRAGRRRRWPRRGRCRGRTRSRLGRRSSRAVQPLKQQARCRGAQLRQLPGQLAAGARQRHSQSVFL